MDEEKIRVLIVDDIHQVREGLKTLLHLASKSSQSRIEVVGEARNGSEAIQQAALLQPEVILMDLEMPIIDGYEATRQIKAAWPATRVIILSIHGGLEEQQLARSAGVDHFVTKDSGYEALLNAIRSTSRPASLNHQKDGGNDE